ncbi:MAG TPA: MlaD family protein [Candidatus Limnocylindrales bacterium]|nr:MlaD family protein [Candidatus Limnocylindrales bacterium]
MSRRGNPVMIGAFVLGAIVLLLAGITAFGSGKFFRKTYKYVLYFDSDVNGLTVGAPVKLKGVPLGTVTDILLNFGALTQQTGPNATIYIPVVIELDADQAFDLGSSAVPDPQTISWAVEMGLRAQLAMESFVTGVLYVKLDLIPGSPLNMRGDPSVPFIEIPTLPTPLEAVQQKLSELMQQFEGVDLRGLVDGLKESVDGIQRIVNSPSLQAAVDNLDDTVADIRSTLGSVRQTADTLTGNIGPLRQDLSLVARDFGTAARELSATLETARLALNNASSLVDPNSPLIVGINETLGELGEASRAVKRLADLIERQPGSLLRGKAVPEEKP